HEEAVVAEVELLDAAVLDRVNRLADAMSAQRSQRAAVRDDQDPLTMVGARDPLDGGEHTRKMVRARLAVVVVGAGEALLDLHAGQPRPGADVDLPQAGIGDDRNSVRRRDDLRRLAGAAE